MTRRLVATEVSDGWLVAVTDTRVVPNIHEVRAEARYHGLKENEIVMFPLPKNTSA